MAKITIENAGELTELETGWLVAKEGFKVADVAAEVLEMDAEEDDGQLDLFDVSDYISGLAPAKTPFVEQAQPVADPINTVYGFKVGDRVKTNGCFTFDPRIGTVAEVSTEGGRLHKVILDEVPEGEDKDYWLYLPYELTHVTGKK